MDNMSKFYTLDGGEKVWALKNINLHPRAEFYPIRKGEFVMIRGPRCARNVCTLAWSSSCLFRAAVVARPHC